MKISQLFKEKDVTLSFEVFPPKTDAGFEAVEKAASEIAALSPDFMSVTYGAGGGTSKNTAKIAGDLQDRFSVPVLAHLTCVSSTKDLVKSVVNEYKERGIENIMALRGDIPKEGRISFDYDHATELIYDIKSIDDSFCIGGACYPEGHVECARQSEDIQHLKEKVDAGCDFLTTQMFFDNSTLYQFLYRIREKGIEVPVVPGIMPITNAKQVARSVALSGSTIPQKMKIMVDRFADEPDKMKEAGIIYACDQIIDLISNGVSHIHVYSMNKPDIAEGIMNNLRSIIR
ncbi:methylenetetrahydrofolate reductase [NAD(P)H] [Butyrivibrio sp. VCB2001]|jgi:methylenetetrahydrofolate reductase (NADPH)|uniref:methylenetetrahydrofolate reductase [NAD(P)H] n=1 Tax=Butyrivibrio sp. VCB2001 TaxID=1280667 RepID=UPI000421EBC9|nr:methylenetetrahydrofolate reductase [NAD(P)H] [Butyrivibrio sp. VCB2001]